MSRPAPRRPAPRRRTPRHRARGTVAVVLAASVLLAGCSGDPDGAEGSDPAGSTPSAASSASGSPAAPSPSQEPTVQPATGPLLEFEDVSVRAPAGWKEDEFPLPTSLVALAPEQPGHSLMLSSTLTFSTTPPTLDELVTVARELLPASERARELDRVEVNGVELYHLVSQTEISRVHAFGTAHGDQSITVRFLLDRDRPAEHQQIIDSVLATLTVG